MRALLLGLLLATTGAEPPTIEVRLPYESGAAEPPCGVPVTKVSIDVARYLVGARALELCAGAARQFLWARYNFGRALHCERTSDERVDELLRELTHQRSIFEACVTRAEVSGRNIGKVQQVLVKTVDGPKKLIDVVGALSNMVPIAWHGEGQNAGVETTVDLKCEVDGKPTTLTWYIDNQSGRIRGPNEWLSKEYNAQRAAAQVRK